jgi:hypothetical protein
MELTKEALILTLGYNASYTGGVQGMFYTKERFSRRVFRLNKLVNELPAPNDIIAREIVCVLQAAIGYLGSPMNESLANFLIRSMKIATHTCGNLECRNANDDLPPNLEYCPSCRDMIESSDEETNFDGFM